MAVVEFEKGGTLTCELSLTDDSVTPNVPVSIAALPDFEYWLYVAPSFIYKFNRIGGTGYKTLIKVDDYNYTALLDADETILLKNGMLKHSFLVALTDADAEAGRFINLVTQETGLKIVSEPISHNNYAG
jgi:hypothetical protein